MANPIGLAVAAIAALVGVIYVAYTHIDELKNRWETLKSALSNPIEAAINFLDHGDVVGGNVKSGEQIAAERMSGGGSFAAPVDTSAAAESVNQLGNASQQAADSTNAFAQNVTANSTAAESLNQNITAIGTGATTLNTTLTGISEGATALGTTLTGIDTGAAGLNMQLPMTTAEVTNLATSAQTSTMPVQMLGTESQNATSGINQLASAASSTAGSLSQIDGAASSVAGALSAKAAEISSIHISVPTVTTTPVAAGGIYPKGEFLTTFAEKSPEAAIPIDNSSRAKSLWQQVGSMLGLLPQQKVTYSAPPDVKNILSTQKPKSDKEIISDVAKILPQRQQQQVAAVQNTISEIEKIASKKTSTADKISGAGNLLSNIGNTFGLGKLSGIGNLISGSSSAVEKIASKKTSTADKISGAGNLLSNIGNTFGLGKLSGIGNLISGVSQNQPPQVDKLFGGSVKLPRERQQNFLPPGNGTDSGIDGLLGGVTSNISSLRSNETSPNINSMPPITVNITIQGNADAETMKTAGNALAIELEKKFTSLMNNFKHEQSRSSFA